MWQHLYFALNDPHVILYTMAWDGAVTVSIIVFVSLVSFSCLKPAKIVSIRNTSPWPYWKKKLRGQMQISHAVTKWLKSCWRRKWRMHQFWNYKTPVRTFTLVNIGWNVSMSTKHATWLRAGDSGCETEYPDLSMPSTLCNWCVMEALSFGLSSQCWWKG